MSLQYISKNIYLQYFSAISISTEIQVKESNIDQVCNFAKWTSFVNALHFQITSKALERLKFVTNTIPTILLKIRLWKLKHEQCKFISFARKLFPCYDTRITFHTAAPFKAAFAALS